MTDPKPATREHKELFLMGFGMDAPRRVVERLFARHGLAMLSDEMLDEGLRAEINNWRLEQRLNRRNRERRSAPVAAE